MSRSNPFADAEDKTDLLQATGGLRSDADDWRDEPLSPTVPQGAATPLAALPSIDASPRRADQPPAAPLEQPGGGPPAPPPPAAYDAGLATPAGYPPGYPPATTASPSGPAPQRSGSYYPPAPGATGAWGAASQPFSDQPPPYGSSSQPHGADGGAAPYGAPPPYQQGAAWTSSGYETGRLSYQPFEQSQAGAPPPKMRCGGLGEMWTLFIVSFILWPGW
jgi:hypothetical protein